MTSHIARNRILVSSVAIALAVVLAPVSNAEVPDGRSAPAPMAPTGGDPPFSWEVIPTGSTGNLVSLDVVTEDVAWAGSQDTAEVLRTVDGGATFVDVAPPEGSADGLQFYDVEANSADEAIVLASGAGDLSRIYRTTDGGATWTETFRATNPASFFNCGAMFDEQRGFAVGDPINDKYQIIVTADAGATWEFVPEDAIPDAQPGEFEWAASGTCANATGKKGWFGTGNAPEARVIRTADYGASWEMAPTPVPSGTNAGIFGVDFRTNRLGLAIGGDALAGSGGLARSTDGGVTWDLVDPSDAPDGFRTGISWWQDLKGDERAAKGGRIAITPEQKTVFAVGLTGSDVSTNRGRTWTQFDSGSLNTVSCLKGSAVCMAAGPFGVVTRLVAG